MSDTFAEVAPVELYAVKGVWHMWPTKYILPCHAVGLGFLRRPSEAMSEHLIVK
jgi:hypothetical protein